MHVLSRIACGDRAVVVVSLRAAVTPVPDRSSLVARIHTFEVGDEIDPVAMEKTLQSMGFLRVPRVTVHGECAVRGEVIDVFPHGEETAVRIVLDFDSIAKIVSRASVGIPFT